MMVNRARYIDAVTGNSRIVRAWQCQVYATLLQTAVPLHLHIALLKYE